jgi:hypothetical protein
MHRIYTGESGRAVDEKEISNVILEIHTVSRIDPQAEKENLGEVSN